MSPEETKARTIAALLPGRWRYAPIRSTIERDWFKHRTNPKSLDRLELVIQCDDNQGRALELRTCWEDESRFKIAGFLGDQTTRASITVAQSRSAKAIAADIERRLLPDYEKAFTDWQEHERRRAVDLETFEIKERLLMQTFPHITKRTWGSPERQYFLHRGTVETYPFVDHEWQLKIQLDFETMMKVIALIQQENPHEPATI